LSYSDIINIVEALIFGSDEEISQVQIKEILNSFRISSSVKEIEEAVNELNSRYEKSRNAFSIMKIAGGYQFATRKEYAHYIGKLYTESQKKKLSQQAIETLSIIAYKQPITRSDIEFVRGVNVDYIVNSLLERDLISITGRANTPGRPILYGTTKNFLKVLGMNSLDDLPKLKEINDILKNEKIEGISEADIDLFNSVNNPESNPVSTEQNVAIEFPENGDVVAVEGESEETGANIIEMNSDYGETTGERSEVETGNEEEKGLENEEGNDEAREHGNADESKDVEKDNNIKEDDRRNDTDK